MTSDTPVRLLGISGSLRWGSYATAVLKGLAEKLGDRASLEIFDLGQIPLYNADLDGDDKPEPVRAFKQAIADSDGLVVSSPEYNYSISGVLKNAIDWASRPGYNSVLKGKPVLYMTSSPGTVGGARAQVHLLELFSATLSRIVLVPHVAVASVQNKVQDGKLTDEASLKFAMGAIDALLAEIRLVSPPA